MNDQAKAGELEQLVLMALAGLGDEASSREVYEAMVDATGREVSVAAVHITLGRLVDKGWAGVRSTPPEPDRGGHARKFYRLARPGAGLLVRLRRQHDRLWAAAEGHPLLAEDGDAAP